MHWMNRNLWSEGARRRSWRSLALTSTPDVLYYEMSERLSHSLAVLCPSLPIDVMAQVCPRLSCEPCITIMHLKWVNSGTCHQPCHQLWHRQCRRLPSCTPPDSQLALLQPSDRQTVRSSRHTLQSESDMAFEPAFCNLIFKGLTHDNGFSVDIELRAYKPDITAWTASIENCSILGPLSLSIVMDGQRVDWKR